MPKLQCKQMNSKELIQCTFGLSKTELKIFLFLLKSNKSVPSNEISKEIGLDRSTIQKSMKGLLDRNIIIRRQINLDNGGYLFLYNIKAKEELKEQMKIIIHNWASNVESQLDEVFKLNE